MFENFSEVQTQEGFWLAASTAPTRGRALALTRSAPRPARAPRKACPKCSSPARRHLLGPFPPQCRQGLGWNTRVTSRPGLTLSRPGAGTAPASCGPRRARATAPRRGGSAALQAAFLTLTCRGCSRSEPARARPRARMPGTRGGPEQLLILHASAASPPGRCEMFSSGQPYS